MWCFLLSRTWTVLKVKLSMYANCIKCKLNCKVFCYLWRTIIAGESIFSPGFTPRNVKWCFKGQLNIMFPSLLSCHVDIFKNSFVIHSLALSPSQTYLTRHVILVEVCQNFKRQLSRQRLDWDEALPAVRFLNLSQSFKLLQQQNISTKQNFPGKTLMLKSINDIVSRLI